MTRTDVTPIKVQNPEKQRAIRKSYLWPYVGDGEHPYIVFDYTPTGSREGPQASLQDFVGTPAEPRYLQCGAFAGCGGLFLPDRHLYEVACWAHARRKFFDAKTTDPVRAHEALTAIRGLYS